MNKFRVQITKEQFAGIKVEAEGREAARRRVREKLTNPDHPIQNELKQGLPRYSIKINKIEGSE